jgi:hypothetical protein
MSSRRQFLGAAAAALGSAPFHTDDARSLESGADVVDADLWDHTFTQEFKGVQYSPVESKEFAWADAPFVTIEAGYTDDAGELAVEFREQDSRRPGEVSTVVFSTKFEEPEYDLELSTSTDVDVATARELAYIILEETEPTEETDGVE